MKKKFVLFIFIISLFLLIAPPAAYAATQSVSASKVLERANELNGKTDWNYNKNGVTYCLLFVSDFWSSNHTFPDGKAGLGFAGSYGWGSALNYCNNFRISTSMDNIPIGADVFFSSSDGYGHIGIYVGDGKFLNAYGEKIRIDSFYNSPYLGNYWANHYLGWGWHQYVNVDDTPVYHPVLAVDDVYSDKAGTITVSGWAYDPDNINQALDIHVYTEDGKTFIGGTTANQHRGDVNAAFNCGEYHGFKATFNTDLSGDVKLHIAALNIGAGHDKWSEVYTVYVPVYHPVLAVDDVYSDKAGTITVCGWAYDPDDINQALDIHVYTEDGKTFIGGTIANKHRGDVNVAFNCGEYHGFEATFNTDLGEDVKLRVAALNIGSGYDKWSEVYTVYVQPLHFKVTNKTITDNSFTCELFFDDTFFEQSAQAILAFYDNQRKLVQLQIKEITVKPGKVNLDFEIENKPYSTYKIMLWDSMKGMKPLCTPNGYVKE